MPFSKGVAFFKFLNKTFSTFVVVETSMIKSIYKAFLGTIIFAITLSSCEQSEGCTDPLAENFDPSAEIENATCITQRQKFLGLFNSIESSNNPNNPSQSFFSEVRSANDNLTDILFFNFNNRFVNPVRALVNRTTFTIDLQDPDGSGLYISGSGSIAGNTVTISYRIKGGFPYENYVYIVNMTK
ncbi:MAG: hypothetical protein RLZZ543_836 [Bacteroidota bacterium]